MPDEQLVYDQFKLITTDIGQGALPNNVINCIEKDRNGELWVGTYQGVCVFNNPSLVFSNYNFASDFLGYFSRNIKLKRFFKIFSSYG